MRSRLLSLGIVAAGVALAAGPARGQAAPTAAPEGRAEAHAELQDAKGTKVGRVTLIQHPRAVVVHGELSRLPPGWHAIHVHAVGKCEPSFEAAGPHLNPAGARHGLEQAGPHAGDLPNIWADDGGVARFDLVTEWFSLRGPARVAGGTAPGTSTSGAPAAATAPGLFDDDGASIVVHARADDYRTDPAGNSGDRIACGVIEQR